MAKTRWQRGQLVEFDGVIAAIVGTDYDPEVPVDHLALWLGEPLAVRKSKVGNGGLRPEVWTIPAEYCTPALEPLVQH